MAFRAFRITPLMLFVLLAGSVSKTGLTQSAVESGPCAYKEIDVSKYGNKPFQNPPAVTSNKGSLNTNLLVKYTDPNTTSIGGCSVKLRSYNGQLVGPTLRAKPGDVLNVLLDNQLPQETPNEVEGQYLQEAQNAYLATEPHSFNTTNLHTHGLHVSPVGNSDNVLLAIPPQDKFAFEIKIPSTHPTGTFWYHSHAHGSTSIQVGSGMAGALIIEDDPTKIPPALREANKHEQVLVIQTTLYNRQGKLDDITKLFPSPSPCPPNDGTWQCSKRKVTINGQIVPVIKMRPGEVQRWRLIDTAFRESINMQLEGHDLHEIALDGIYLGRIDTWSSGQVVELQPGYRSDVLVQAGKAGTYKLIDAATAAPKSLRGVAEDENLLALVKVEGEPLPMSLPTNAEMAPLAPFPGVDLSQTAVGVQQAQFKLGSDFGVPPGICQKNPSSPKCKQRNYFQINYQAFNPAHVRQLQLGATEQWTLTTVGDPADVPNAIPPLPHVFHIHINPFQFNRVGPDGKSETVWKDTLLVPPGQTLNIYTRYLDYIGQFVMHCHILDHEDLGMMEVDEVVDTATGVKASHRH